MEATATVHGKGTSLHVTHGDDTSLWVKFYFNKVYEQDFVKIRVPGDTKTEWDRPVSSDDKKRFAAQWRAYEEKAAQHGTDTLIEDADFLNESQVEHLKGYNVATVRQLANMADGFIAGMGPGAREMQKKAVLFIRDEAQKVKEQQLAEENRVLNNKLATMEVRMAELEKKLEEKPKRQTRKKKVDDAS